MHTPTVLHPPRLIRKHLALSNHGMRESEALSHSPRTLMRLGGTATRTHLPMQERQLGRRTSYPGLEPGESRASDRFTYIEVQRLKWPRALSEHGMLRRWPAASPQAALLVKGSSRILSSGISETLRLGAVRGCDANRIPAPEAVCNSTGYFFLHRQKHQHCKTNKTNWTVGGHGNAC